MKRLLTLAAAAALAVPAVAFAHTADKLTGTVGPGFTIELKKGNIDVKRLKPGTYTLRVQDMAASHNFHLFGPGLNKSTSVPFTGTQTWKIRLRKGTYTYQCDPHAGAGMKGTFRVRS